MWEETLEGDRYAYGLDGGNGFMGGYLPIKCVQFITCQLHLNKEVQPTDKLAKQTKPPPIC